MSVRRAAAAPAMGRQLDRNAAHRARFRAKAVCELSARLPTMLCVRTLRVMVPDGGSLRGPWYDKALRERSMHWEGSYADGLAARVCCGIGAVGERALLARVRRDRLGDV